MKKHLLSAILVLFINLSFTQTTHTVNAGNFYYNPSDLTIEQGDMVIWINDGGFHDVNGDIETLTGLSYNNPESFDSEAMNTPGGEIYSHVFNIIGEYNYDCSVGTHAANGMIGSITVIPNEDPCQNDDTTVEQFFGGFGISDCNAVVEYLSANYGYSLAQSCNWDGQPMNDFDGLTIGDFCECTCEEKTSIIETENYHKEEVLFSINIKGQIVRNNSQKESIIFDIYESGKVLKKFIVR
jgi:plastocyanin